MSRKLRLVAQSNDDKNRINRTDTLQISRIRSSLNLIELVHKGERF